MTISLQKLQQFFQNCTKLLQLYYKLRQWAIINYGKFITNYIKTLLQIAAALLQITTVRYYKLWQLYYKLRQNMITNYGSFITNYDNVLLQITAALLNYCKLQQLLVLLQITAGITIYDFITNYIITNFYMFFFTNMF